MTTSAGFALDQTSFGRALAAVACALLLGAVIGALGPAYGGALVVAAAVVAMATARPERALLLLPLAIYAPVRESLSATVNVSLGDVVLGLVAVGWLLWAWRRHSLLLDRDLLLAVLAMLVAAPALSLINSPARGLTLFGMLRTVELWALVFAVVLSSVRTVGALSWLLRGFVLATAVEALVGIYQFASATGAYVVGGYTRAYGTGSLYSWLDFSVALGCAIVLLVADLLVERRGGAWRWAALLVLVMGTAATYTRGVWLALMAAVVVMVLASRPRALIAVVLVGCLALAIVAANPTSDLSRRVVSVGDPNDPSVVQRLYLWQTALRIFDRHPLIGAGAKSFPLLRDRYAVPGLQIYSYHDTPGATLRVELLSPHNYYLLLAAETGLVGLGGFLALLGLLLGRGLRTARRTAGDLRAAALGGSGVVVFLAAHALIGDMFAGPIALTGAFLLACLAAATQIDAREAAACRIDRRERTAAAPA